MMNIACLAFVLNGLFAPWNITELKQAPASEAVSLSQVDGMTSLLYQGLSYNGTNTQVFSYYGIPEGTPPEGGWPAVVCVHGGGGTAYPDWVRKWNTNGYAAIAMDLEGHWPEWTGALTHNKIDLEFGGPSRAAIFNDWQLPVEQQWFYHAVGQVILAHSLIRSFPEINAEKIGITGISWGGILTCAVSGLDDRFKFAVPVYGCGFLPESDGVMGVSMTDAADGRVEWVQDHWDPSNFLSKTGMPVLWVNGSNDQHFPMEVSQKSADLIPGSVHYRYEIEMKHSHPAGWDPPEIYKFADSILQGGAVFPTIGKPVQNEATLQALLSSVGDLNGAVLCYTLDSGEWLLRSWQTAPAALGSTDLSATVPFGATAAFFSCTDTAGILYSSPMAELTPVTNTVEIEDGFAYGTVTNFQHNVLNPDAAGGTGFAETGWKQFNVSSDGLILISDVASIATPAGYNLIKSDGVMSVKAGGTSGSGTATWAIRFLESPLSLNTTAEYWFSVLIRNNDNWTSGSADSASFRLCESGKTLISAGFNNSEQLQITLGTNVVSGTDSTLFAKGNNITLIGKLMVDPAGDDTLSVCAFRHTDTIAGEPTSWDLTVSGAFGDTQSSYVGFWVNDGNSKVDVDEIRIGSSFEDVVGLSPE